MLLRHSNSCYDTQGLERVLLVFDGGLNDRPYGGVVFYTALGLQPSASLMPLLPTCLATGRFAQGLRMRNAYRILGRRNAAIRTGLDYGFHAVLKFRDADFQLFNLNILADKTTIQDIENKALLVQLLRQFRGVQILGESHIPEELLAPPGVFHSVCLKAFSLSGIKISSHTSKVGKRFDICKYNTLSANWLNVIYEPSGEGVAALLGGPGAKFLKVSMALWYEKSFLKKKFITRWRKPRANLCL